MKAAGQDAMLPRMWCAVTNDCISFKCELATNIADGAGASNEGQAYHWLNNGSTSTFCFR